MGEIRSACASPPPGLTRQTPMAIICERVAAGIAPTWILPLARPPARQTRPVLTPDFACAVVSLLVCCL